MKFIAGFLPPRFAVIALQEILLNGNSIFHPDVLINWGLLLALSAVIFVIGVRLFKKFISPG
jgi:ABC-type multidrug transport system permease subunit